MQLAKAAVEEIGRHGTLDVTVGQIAKRAGVSSALVFHYYGDKEKLFLGAMRYVLSVYGAEIRNALINAKSHQERLEAVIKSNFNPSNFKSETIAAWLNFYVLAQNSKDARRLLSIYHQRLLSNLTHALRPYSGERAVDIALRLSAQIDGLYLRAALRSGQITGEAATHVIMQSLKYELDNIKGSKNGDFL